MAGGLAAQLIAVAILVIPSPGAALFVIPLIVPLLILGPLAITKGKPWMYLGGGICLAIFPALTAPFAPDSFYNPLLGPVFASTMLLLLGVFLGLPAGVWVFRHRKGPPGSVSARDGLRTRYGIFTVLVSGILLGAGIAAEAAYLGATSSGASSGADLTPQANVTVAAENFFFVPATLTIPSDRLVEVTVINKDNARHTFTYTVYKGRADERTYNHELLPLTTTKFTMLVLAPGSVHFWCIPHEAMGMVGDFTVT